MSIYRNDGQFVDGKGVLPAIKKPEVDTDPRPMWKRKLWSKAARFMRLKAGEVRIWGSALITDPADETRGEVRRHIFETKFSEVSQKFHLPRRIRRKIARKVAKRVWQERVEQRAGRKA